MKTDFVLKDGKGNVVRHLGRTRPSLRALASEFGKRCEKENLAVYRRETTVYYDEVETTKEVLVGKLSSTK